MGDYPAIYPLPERVKSGKMRTKRTVMRTLMSTPSSKVAADTENKRKQKSLLHFPSFICPSADYCPPARQLMQCMLSTPQRTAGWITNTMKSFEAATPVRRCMAVIANVARRYVIHRPIHRLSEMVIGPDCSFSIMRRLGPFRRGCNSPFGARPRARPRRQQARVADWQILTRTRRPSRDIATRGRGRRRRLDTGISAFPNTQQVSVINAKAADMHKRKREEVESEAARGGRYRRKS